MLKNIVWISVLAAVVVSPVASYCLIDANGLDPYIAYSGSPSTVKPLPLYLNQGGGVLPSTTSKGIGLQATLSKEQLLAQWSYSNVTGIIRAFHDCSNLVLNVGPSPAGGYQPLKRQDSVVFPTALTPLTWGVTSTTHWDYVKQGNVTIIAAKYKIGETKSIPPYPVYATYSSFYACQNNVGTWSLYLIPKRISDPVPLDSDFEKPATDITGAAITLCKVTQIAVRTIRSIS